MTTTLISSPLQSFTDYRFRNAFQKYFGGIDFFYAPYIRMNGKLVIKPLYERDLALKNNKSITVVPQIMTCSAEEFIFAARYVRSLGYDELNWNLGCPYPMVTTKGLGSGLIARPADINHILQRVHEETDIVVSMKMRLGYDTSDEILDTLPVLARYPIRSVAVHARIGKQLYRGGVDLAAFAQCLRQSEFPVYYNGDIKTVADYRRMQELFPSVTHWLLGRGLIADPCLPEMIKADTDEYPTDRMDRFGKFHDTLQYQYQEKLSGDKHVIMKMYSYWEYFATSMSAPAKILKKIKKCKTLSAYDEAVSEILLSKQQSSITTNQY